MTKWQMNRAGLLNFWYYDDETFELADGKLLLRGTNGSGKSVTMQSFIPVLLDGRKTPDRLDPFGSKARKMSDYLLGEEEITNREERTGYLFLEYKMKGSEQYITTGIGMQARRNKDLKSWYFIITDNRRIGFDFDLAHRNKAEIIPYSQKELQNRIAVGGVVTDSQKEYAELVNKYIFGFETMEAYEDLVKLLIQLRAPKLSKDFKPTVIYEILESALPPLTDDELRHLSDTIESMDQTQQQLEQLTLEFEANKKILKRYKTYNEYILAERADRVIKAEQRLVDLEEKKAEQSKALSQAKQNAEKLADEQVTVNRNLDVAEKEKTSLSKHKVWDLQEQLKENEQLLDSVESNIEKQQKRKDDSERKRIQLLGDIRKKQEELSMKEAEQRTTLQEMQALAADADFTAHTLNVESLARQSAQFDYWQQEITAHKEKLRQVKRLVSEYQHLQGQDKELERKSSELSKEIDMKQKELDQAQQWFDEELHQLKTSIFAWMQSYEQLDYSAEEQQQISRILEQMYEKAAYYEATNILMDGLNSYRGELKVEIKENEKYQQKIREDITLQQEHLVKLKSEELAEPERMQGTIAFRQQLEEKQIPFVPFYAAVEYQTHVTDEQKARLEAVLRATGVLDSLISPETFEVQEDSLLIPNEQLLGYTLADFLQPDVDVEGITPGLVDEILRSIPIDVKDGVFSVDERGFYRLGIVNGHAPELGPSKFIGRTSRKRYQQEQIATVEAHIEQLQSELLQVQQQLADLTRAYDVTKEWEAAMPTDKALHDIHTEMLETKTEQRFLKDELLKNDTTWNEIRQQLKEVRQKLHQAQDILNIAQTKKAINEALQLMDDYLQEFNKLRRTLIELTNAKTRVEELQQQLEELEDTLADYQDELIDSQNKQAKLEAEIFSQKQQLQLEGADEIQQRIAQLQDELKRLRERDDQIRTDLPRKQSEIERLEEQLKRSITEVNFAQLMLQQWQQALQNELDLEFVPVDSYVPKEILAQLKEKLQLHERSKLHENLSKVIQDEMNNLAEYHVSSYLKETEMLEELVNSDDERLEAFIQLKGRRVIELEYRGQRVSPYTINRALQDELEERRHYLDEQDRELYEDIIVNSVGRILRQRIARAEQWVKQMDEIMAKRDNSSGLIFSVSWKPRTA
ncbi:MAG: TIGR02680 family protein, partial [Lysinibacillus sp.]